MFSHFVFVFLFVCVFFRKVATFLAKYTKTNKIVCVCVCVISYNIADKKKEYVVKRRIPLKSIEMITVSKTSPEFAIHVPSEYDYRYASAKNKMVIAEMISERVINNYNQPCAIAETELKTLKDVVISKKLSKIDVLYYQSPNLCFFLYV